MSQPPLPLGTILQNRYHLLSLLGQGTFGRTYLAEDQGRFNERCTIKEFIPSQTHPEQLAKSKELFQREASTLYQLQHPQVPQFRATFEQDGRLFLVQDYVDGQTYQTLLNQRQLTPHPQFEESEIKLFLEQLLPVLAYIHSKGIVHRDIAPDNIILRFSDRLPVLIDFGVVKALANQLRDPDSTIVQSTSVGKVGYAPKEQVQLGMVYPSSDLYALAVTAIVLLTGKEPAVLFDSQQMQWNWQRFVTVSPSFAQVLNRMLSYQPSDRFANASEVLNTLKVQFPAPPTPQTPPQPPPPSQPSTSQVATIAVGRQPEPLRAQRRTPNPPAYIPPDPPPFWDNPWAVIIVGGLVAIAAGVTSVVVVTQVINRQQAQTSPTPVITPTPAPISTATSTPTPIQTPSPPPIPIRTEQILDLRPNAVTSLEDTLHANETLAYVIFAKEGQTLRTDVRGEGVLMSVYAPDRQLASERAQNVSSWEGTISPTGEYTVELQTVRGLETAKFKLDLYLNDPTVTPTPTATPTPTLTPTPTPTVTPTPTTEIEEEPVIFPPDTPGIQVAGQTRSQRIKRYLVKATEGQLMTLEILQGDARLTVRYPNGEVVEDAMGLKFWQSQVTQSGVYQVDAIADQPTEFVLSIKVEQ